MSATSAYDVLLLDFGGVCLLNPVELHARAEQLLGLPADTFTWLGPLDPSTDALWRQMIAGEGGMTERRYWTQRAEEVGRAAGQELSRDDYMRLLYDPPTPGLVRAEAEAVVRAAQQAGFGVSVLTNDMRDFHGRTWELQIPLLQTVDHIFDCSDTKILKPDPRAYTRVLDGLDVAPERVLFVDDQPRNVQGAVDCGLDAVWFDIANASSAWDAVATRLGVSADTV